MDCHRKHLRQSLKVRLDCKMCLGRPENVASCSRELLDSWMFDVCGIGMPFRDAFMSWKREASTTSSEILWVDQPILSKRRIGNVGFNAFLKTLRFSNNLDLTELFSCLTCLIDDGNGNTQWTGIVMDGAATGILNKPPRFHRPTHVVPRMKGKSSAQYIMPPFSLREFAEVVFTLAKKYDGADMINLKLSSLPGKHGAHSADAFFSNLRLTKEVSCAYITRLFMQGFFSQVTT